MIKERINWVGLSTILFGVIIFAVIGISLPNTINFLNGLDENAFYGHFASYVVSLLLFWLCYYKTNLTIKRENYIILLDKFIKKNLRKVKK